MQAAKTGTANNVKQPRGITGGLVDGSNRLLQSLSSTAMAQRYHASAVQKLRARQDVACFKRQVRRKSGFQTAKVPPMAVDQEVMFDRRKTPRYATDTQAQLTMAEGSMRSESITIRNISAGGLQFVTAEPLRQGDRLQLCAEEVELDGRVQYCCRWQRGYVAGIVIDDIRFQGAQLASADLVEYWAALQEA